MFYLNPESSAADRFVCGKIDAMPQGERGRSWRAALLTGFALGKQDERIPYLISELLDENTTFDDILQLMKAIFPREMDNFQQDRQQDVSPGQQIKSQQAPIHRESDPKAETRANARGMFGVKKVE